MSVGVCNMMTKLGYGEEIRRKRVEMYMNNDMLANAQSLSAVTQITAGSKGEGLACWGESDLDIVFVIQKVLCVEAGVDLHTILDAKDVYRMDTRLYLGYCRMLLEKTNSTGLPMFSPALWYDGKEDFCLAAEYL
ncbi:hypothetical protein DPMN_040671 [Dreissena polymorpha]|uniref:Uncharacterized protein n=1 Tax=Dreissena polymorpha TaxID=45954 RepID=A0A9D4CXD6_DREPO|nr:hypothetical protein DPMN_040671 [Dreissena polymorpha]